MSLFTISVQTGGKQSGHKNSAIQTTRQLGYKVPMGESYFNCLAKVDLKKKKRLLAYI